MLLLLMPLVTTATNLTVIEMSIVNDPIYIYVNETLRLPLQLWNGTLLNHNVSIDRAPNLCALTPSTLNVSEHLLTLDMLHAQLFAMVAVDDNRQLVASESHLFLLANEGPLLDQM